MTVVEILSLPRFGDKELGYHDEHPRKASCLLTFLFNGLDVPRPSVPLCKLRLTATLPSASSNNT